MSLSFMEVFRNCFHDKIFLSQKHLQYSRYVTACLDGFARVRVLCTVQTEKRSGFVFRFVRFILSIISVVSVKLKLANHRQTY